MKLYRPTPMARRHLSAGVRDAIAAAKPAGHLVHLGYGTSGWTCRILTPETVAVSEAFDEASPLIAFLAAWSRMPDEPDALDVAKRERELRGVR